jgi:vacuolar-type H+-ATPase subunit E/Vma4
MNDVEVREHALEPLRIALLARARTDADNQRAAAEDEGRRDVEAARREADAALAEARSRGESDAAGMLAVERAQARRTARAVVLAAQHAAYDDLCRHARAAVADLLADPDRHRHLAETVRERLGEGAVVRDDPAGGVVAESPDGRRIDASVDALVTAAIGELDLEQLWAAR